ncbi:MAG: diguanylate cyclase [Deltaproteobacteria bacterium]
MDSFSSLITKAALLFLGIALFAEYLFRRRKLLAESGKNRSKQQKLIEFSKELKLLKKNLARKTEIADQIPLIIKKLTENLSQSSLPAMAVRSAKELFHAEKAGFFTPVNGTAEYTLEVGAGFPPDWQGKIRIDADEGILGMALQKKVVVSRMDPLSFAGRRSSSRSLEQLGAIPDFVAPVFGVSGTIGALVIAGCPFPLEEERKYMSMLADLLSTAMQKATLIDSSISRSWVDHLTGVSNRLHFLQRFESEVRRSENYRQALALFMFDIDEFKKINDTYGHAAGDVVLKKMVEIVRQNTRSSDLIGRFGGDEFMVLMMSSNAEQSRHYAEKLREIISATDIRIPGQDAPVRLTISGGLAMWPVDGQSTTELMQCADVALYEAKRKGRNNIVLIQSLGLDGAILHGQGSEPAKQVPAAGDNAAGIEEKDGVLELCDDEWESLA